MNHNTEFLLRSLEYEVSRQLGQSSNPKPDQWQPLDWTQYQWEMVLLAWRLSLQTEDSFLALLVLALVVGAESQGSTSVMVDQIQGDGWGLDPELLENFPWDRALAAVVAEPWSSSYDDQDPKGLVVLDGKRVYLQRFFSQEQCVADFFASAEPLPSVDGEAGGNRELHKRLLSDDDFSPYGGHWQGAAMDRVFHHRWALISGGPGTGKTTILGSCLALLLDQHPSLRIALAAPTGKAAQRMGQALAARARQMAAQGIIGTDRTEQLEQIEPRTVHRLLGYIPGSAEFRHNKNNPLGYDLVAVDEASMVDLPLMARLIDALGPSTRLVLLGDHNQLASVQAGALVRDLVDHWGVNRLSKSSAQRVNAMVDPKNKINGDREDWDSPVVALQKTYRFGDQDPIGLLSRGIVACEDPQQLWKLCQDRSLVLDPTRPDLAKELATGFEPLVRASDDQEALDALGGAMVLCLTNEGPWGQSHWNDEIAASLQAQQRGQRWRGTGVNTPILIVENAYTLGLFNGDMGLVRPTPPHMAGDLGSLCAVFPGEGDQEPRRFALWSLPPWQRAWAMTVHKSQGSEFERVSLILPTEDSPLLTRELVYTGITRAKKRLHLVSRRDPFLGAVARTVERSSGLGRAMARRMGS